LEYQVTVAVTATRTRRNRKRKGRRWRCRKKAEENRVCNATRRLANKEQHPNAWLGFVCVPKGSS